MTAQTAEQPISQPNVPVVFEFSITGMTCGGCAGRVEKAFKATDGVLDSDVNLATEHARVFVHKDAVKPEALIHAIEDIGFGATLSTADDVGGIADEDFGTKSQHDFIVAALALVLSAPLVAQMAWMWLGHADFITPLIQIGLAGIVQFVCAARFYRPAWYAAKSLSGNMDLLVVTGTLAAFGLSVANVWRGEGDLYFEASSAVIALVLLGKWMESRAKRSATAALRGLLKLRPSTATVLRDGVELEIPIAHLSIDDRFVVRPGQRIPADGVVEDGSAALDESMMTGESLPVTRGPGDTVTGGVANVDGVLVVRATAVGADSVLSRIVQIVDQAQSEKAPIQRFVDRVAAVFVPVVLVIALATFAGWLINGASLPDALIIAVSVLVVACPCALGLATPTAITVGTGVAARHGILIRDIAALEHAHATTAVVFDKTGTLTAGVPEVIDVQCADGVTRDELLRLTASVQHSSLHPLAVAILDYAADNNIATQQTRDFSSVTGKGVTATVGEQRIAAGNLRFMADHGLAVADSQLAPAPDLPPSTAVWVADFSDTPRLLGVLRLADQLRPGARNAIEELHRAGITSVLLTGDADIVARDVAARLGIKTVMAEVLPEDKAAEVAALRAQGYVVAMVGDGVNDAPALATADIGIAMGSGADIAIDSAAITLMQSSPERITDAIAVSRATYAKIRQNLFWAFVYNVIALPLAALGMLSPVIAGAAMALSSVSVVSNSLLLRRWKSVKRNRARASS